MSQAFSGAPTPRRDRLELILSSDHPLTKEDVVWVLEVVKKKVADGDPRLLDLDQPRLLQNFQHYAEASLLLINRRMSCSQEADRLRICLREAAHGLYDPRQLGIR